MVGHLGYTSLRRLTSLRGLSSIPTTYELEGSAAPIGWLGLLLGDPLLVGFWGGKPQGVPMIMGGTPNHFLV